MKTLRCLVVFFLIHLSLIAQKNFDPGYIIKHAQDTVRGFIEVAMESELTMGIKFKTEANSELKEYAPADLLGFGLEQNVYRSMRFLNTSGDTLKETAFVKQLVSGEYSLFYYVTPDRNFYLLQKDTSIYFLYDRISSSSGEIIKEGNYQNYLHLISIPCEKLSNRYERVEFDNKNMANFVLAVDQCISGNATSFYQKQKTAIQPFVFVGGLPISGTSQFTANFTLQFTLPRIDNHASLNIGIDYSNTVKTTPERNISNHFYNLITRNIIYSVPVTFQYNFTTTRVQPYIYGGFSGAYLVASNDNQIGETPPSPQFQAAGVLGMGIQAMIFSKLFIRLDWRYEIILQNPAIGILYRF